MITDMLVCVSFRSSSQLDSLPWQSEDKFNPCNKKGNFRQILSTGFCVLGRMPDMTSSCFHLTCGKLEVRWSSGSCVGILIGQKVGGSSLVSAVVLFP